jgi:hypothetical protein
MRWENSRKFILGRFTNDSPGWSIEPVRAQQRFLAFGRLRLSDLKSAKERERLRY